jgi:hypothetical protein
VDLMLRLTLTLAQNRNEKIATIQIETAAAQIEQSLALKAN